MAVVSVRILYHPGRQPTHVQRFIAYLVKVGKGRGGGEGLYLTRDGEPFDRDAFESQLWGDPWCFQVLLSPAPTVDDPPLEDITKQWMLALEDRIGRSIDYVAARHFDGATPHVHLLWRGRDGTGKPLKLRKHLITHELRELAETIEGWYT